MRVLSIISLFSLFSVFAWAQETDQSQNLYRSSIPEELLRPKRGEAPTYPIDTVIGELGQGYASDAAYSYARYIASGLLSGQASSARLEEFLPVLESIAPNTYRIGGGREEPDGAISFLVRYIGRERSITGELFVRFVSRQIVEEDGTTTRTTGSWTFDDLILEDAKSREEEQKETIQRFDFSPYERFY
uniref:Uncharacterized protein n=1 Tax=uncultured bacterium contig00054 TaxID=1181538 RepID=A0A806K1M3_9BACT|nr:hypothetical protein [uncultured bacterium contig00054]